MLEKWWTISTWSNCGCHGLYLNTLIPSLVKYSSYFKSCISPPPGQSKAQGHVWNKTVSVFLASHLNMDATEGNVSSGIHSVFCFSVGCTAVCSRALRQSRADRSHENLSDCRAALTHSCCRNSSSVSARNIFSWMDATSCGSKSASLMPATSGMDVVLEAITGAPQRIASSTGNPKPSSIEGKIKRSQRLYNRTRSSSLT